jgi:hypothetical protein
MGAIGILLHKPAPMKSIPADFDASIDHAAAKNSPLIGPFSAAGNPV